MNWIATKLELIGRYLLARLQEPSTYRGLLIVVTAGAWHELDNASRGEVIMQCGLILAGMIQAVVPQSKLYAPSKQP